MAFVILPGDGWRIRKVTDGSGYGDSLGALSKAHDELAKVERYPIFIPSAQLDIMIYVPLPSFSPAVCVMCAGRESLWRAQFLCITRMSYETFLIFQARKRNTPMLLGGGSGQKLRPSYI